MKSFTTKTSAAALMTTLALGAGALKFLYSSPVETHASSPRATKTSNAANAEQEAPAPAIPLRQWKEGESFVYEIDTTRSMAMTTQDEAEQVLSYHVVGKLVLTVIGKDGHAVRLRADIEPTNLDVAPPSEKDAQKLMSGTFYLQTTTKGEIKEFHFPKEIATEARILLKGLVNSFQMVVPPAKTAKWQVVEADVSGQYQATYSAIDESTVKKSKIKYITTRGVSGFVKMHKGLEYAVQSEATFGMHASGWPKSLAENESLEVTLQKNRMRGKIQTTAKLARVEMRPQWVGAFPAGLESDTVSEAAAREIATKQADVNMVGGRSFATIMGELKGENAKSRSQAQARMAALFRVDPSQAKKAVDEILKGNGDDNSKKRLIGSLGSAGTPDAQHELARILQAKEAGENRINAAVAMGLTKHPTEETARALKESSRDTEADVANTAILASGNVVRTMNADGIPPTETADAVQMLIDGLANATTDSQRQVYLDALGNTGDQRVLGAVMPYLSHTTVALRAAAVGALKFMVVPEADALIIAAMTDTAFSVRKAAVHTIAFRPIDGVLEAVDALLKTEPEIAIRTEILKGLNTKLREDAIVIDSVAWAMENDPSGTVRAYAKQIVDAYRVDDGV